VFVTLTSQNFDSAAHIGLWLSPRKCFTQFKPNLDLKSYTTNLKSLPSGQKQKQNCPHEQGSYAYSRVVIQGSCHCVLLLATNAMLEQFQMSCFGGSKFSHPISLDACCTSSYLTAPISSEPRLSICMHFVPGVFITQGFFLEALSYLHI
jgi:hypothetical protein